MEPFEVEVKLETTDRNEGDKVLTYIYDRGAMPLTKEDFRAYALGSAIALATTNDANCFDDVEPKQFTCNSNWVEVKEWTVTDLQ